MYCSNGSILEPTNDDIAQLLTSFKKANQFKGNSEYWSTYHASMEETIGETLAYIDDKNRLVVLSENVFSSIIPKKVRYVTVSEFAAMHGKCRASVKNMCAAGRIEGANKTDLGWLIPSDAKYPKRKKKE